MKTSNWSILGYVIGFLFSLFCAIRYFLLYPDTSEALNGIIQGLEICAFAWIFNQILKLKNTLDGIEEYLA